MSLHVVVRNGQSVTGVAGSGDERVPIGGANGERDVEAERHAGGNLIAVEPVIGVAGDSVGAGRSGVAIDIDRAADGGAGAGGRAARSGDATCQAIGGADGV